MQGFVWSGLSLAGLLAGALLGGRLVPVLLSNGTQLALRAGGRAGRRGRVCRCLRGGGQHRRRVDSQPAAARGVRVLDSVGGVVAGALIGLRDRVGARRDGAAAAGPGRPAARRAALVRAAAAERDRAAALAAQRARPDRPVPELRRAAAADRAARPARAATRRACARLPRASCACSAPPAGSASRAAAGSRPRARRHRGARRRRRGGHRGRDAPRRRCCGRRRWCSTRTTTSPCCTSTGLEAPPLRARRTRGRAPRRDRRLPGERAARGERRADRRDRDRARAGRLRPGQTRRLVTSLSGTIQHGNSGGPAVDASGAVQSTVFAARAAGGGGYGVPASIVRRDLACGGQRRSRPGPASASPVGRAPLRAA